MSDPIRVLVADDHPAVLSGLVTLLDSAPDITVVAQAVDGTSALRAAQQHRPDVVLTDVRMPGATGIDITPRLRGTGASVLRSEEHTSELQSRGQLVCRLLLEKER